MKTIYDIGANNGDDITYYLMKADKVIAVEANPVLCNEIRDRFATAISEHRLEVINCVVTSQEQGGEVDFYVSRVHHALSQFPRPPEDSLSGFDRVRFPAHSIGTLLNKYGKPYYMKIDIEGYDAELLEAAFGQGVFPDYISAESHRIEVFALLVGTGQYKAFKLVEGSTVGKRYARRTIADERTKQSTIYTFPEHSAGPFGGDIDGPWMTAHSLFSLLAFSGLGWKDIHASRVDQPDEAFQPRVAPYLNQHATFSELLGCLALKSRNWLRRHLASAR